ncbi:MAG: hypothetical protein JOZ36_02615 [Acidobacteria bacterium]|nr:hypothetical protein [Acidobacteriota bacterium]
MLRWVIYECGKVSNGIRSAFAPLAAGRKPFVRGAECIVRQLLRYMKGDHSSTADYEYSQTVVERVVPGLLSRGKDRESTQPSNPYSNNGAHEQQRE